MTTSFTVLLEEDYASNNFCAYIPELRLNVVGDTEEETLALANDLIKLQLMKSPNRQRYSSKVITVEIDENIECRDGSYPAAV